MSSPSKDLSSSYNLKINLQDVLSYYQSMLSVEVYESITSNFPVEIWREILHHFLFTILYRYYDICFTCDEVILGRFRLSPKELICN